MPLTDQMAVEKALEVVGEYNDVPRACSSPLGPCDLTLETMLQRVDSMEPFLCNLVSGVIRGHNDVPRACSSPLGPCDLTLETMLQRVEFMEPFLCDLSDDWRPPRRSDQCPSSSVTSVSLDGQTEPCDLTLETMLQRVDFLEPFLCNLSNDSEHPRRFEQCPNHSVSLDDQTAYTSRRTSNDTHAKVRLSPSTIGLQPAVYQITSVTPASVQGASASTNGTEDTQRKTTSVVIGDDAGPISESSDRAAAYESRGLMVDASKNPQKDEAEIRRISAGRAGKIDSSHKYYRVEYVEYAVPAPTPAKRTRGPRTKRTRIPKGAKDARATVSEDNSLARCEPDSKLLEAPGIGTMNQKLPAINQSASDQELKPLQAAQINDSTENLAMKLLQSTISELKDHSQQKHRQTDYKFHKQALNTLASQGHREWQDIDHTTASSIKASSRPATVSHKEPHEASTAQTQHLGLESQMTPPNIGRRWQNRRDRNVAKKNTSVTTNELMTIPESNVFEDPKALPVKRDEDFHHSPTQVNSQAVKKRKGRKNNSRSADGPNVNTKATNEQKDDNIVAASESKATSVAHSAIGKGRKALREKSSNVRIGSESKSIVHSPLHHTSPSPPINTLYNKPNNHPESINQNISSHTSAIETPSASQPVPSAVVDSTRSNRISVQDTSPTSVQIAQQTHANRPNSTKKHQSSRQRRARLAAKEVAKDLTEPPPLTSQLLPHKSADMNTSRASYGRVRSQGRLPGNRETEDSSTSFGRRAPSVSSVSTNRRRRGFQPDEVRKTKPVLADGTTPSKVEISNENFSKTEFEKPLEQPVDTVAEPLQPGPSSSEESTKTLLASGTLPTTNGQSQKTEKHTNSVKVTAPHKRKPVSQATTKADEHNAERGLSKAKEATPSACSSVEIITDDQPQQSCWSRALPTEAPLPANTDWDSETANIVNPIVSKARIPPYRVPGSNRVSKPSTVETPDKATAADAYKRFEKALRLPHPSQSPQKQKPTYAEALDMNKPTLVDHPPLVDQPEEELAASPIGNSQTATPQTSPHHDTMGKGSLPPHLRKKTVPQVQTKQEDNAEENLIAAMQSYVPPAHLQNLPPPKSRAPRKAVPDPSPLHTDITEAVQPEINIDEEVAAGEGIANIENDAEIAAAIAASEEHGNDEQVAFDLQARLNDQDTLKLDAEADKPSKQDQPKSIPPHLRVKTSTAKANNHISQRRHNGTVKTTETNGHNHHGQSANGLGQVHDPSGLGGWDGKFAPAPVGDQWDERAQHDPKGKEKRAVIKTWTEDHTADETSVAGNTERHPPSPVRKVRYPETIPNPDEFTQFKSHISASDHIQAYEAKRSASGKSTTPEKSLMNREERREHRRLMREAEAAKPILLSEHRPEANIYLRPAEMQDMRQVAWLHNDWVRDTPCSYELAAKDEVYWRSRFQEAYDEADPFLIAVTMGDKIFEDVRQIRRKKTETIVGFAFASDYGLQDTSYRYTVELEVWVHQEYLRKGIGKTLLDRMLASLDPGYNFLERVPMVGNYSVTKWIGGGHCVVKTILCNLHHNEDSKKELAIRKKLLTDHNFFEVGTIPISGWKFGKALNTCQMIYHTQTNLPKM